MKTDFELEHVPGDPYPPESRGEAYELFIQGNSYQDIGITLGIKADQIRRWASSGKWATRKKQIEEEAIERCDAEYRKFIMDNRLATLERHLRVSTKLEDGVERVLDEELQNPVPSGRELERMSRALAAATGVSARATAISETPAVVEKNEGKQGKTPLVVVGVQVTKAGDVTVDAKEVTPD